MVLAAVLYNSGLTLVKFPWLVQVFGAFALGPGRVFVFCALKVSRDCMVDRHILKDAARDAERRALASADKAQQVIADHPRLALCVIPSDDPANGPTDPATAAATAIAKLNGINANVARKLNIAIARLVGPKLFPDPYSPVA